MPSEHQLEKQQDRLERKQDQIEHKLEANERRQDNHERRDFELRHEYPERHWNEHGGYGDRKLEKQQEHLEREQEHIERKLEANERRQDNHDRRDFEIRHDNRGYHGHDGAGYGDNSISPVFHPNRRTRILLSPNHGSGWITEAPRSASDAFLVWMLTYEPLIRALEHREHPQRIEEILEDFHRECHVGYGIERIRTPRPNDLVVREVDEPFEIKEHEGKENINHVTKVELMAHRKIIRM